MNYKYINILNINLNKNKATFKSQKVDMKKNTKKQLNKLIRYNILVNLTNRFNKFSLYKNNKKLKKIDKC